MTLSKAQEKTILLIKRMEAEFGKRWFVKAELDRITQHSMDALVMKGYLEVKNFHEIVYYQSTW